MPNPKSTLTLAGKKYTVQTALLPQESKTIEFKFTTANSFNDILVFEKFFTALHGIKTGSSVTPLYSFEVTASSKEILFRIVADKTITELLKGVVDSHLHVGSFVVKDYALVTENYERENLEGLLFELKLKNHFLYPISALRKEVTVDPLLSLFTVLDSLEVDQKVDIVMVIRPFIDAVWQEYAKEALKNLAEEGDIPNFAKYLYSGGPIVRFIRFLGKGIDALIKSAKPSDEKGATVSARKVNPFINDALSQIRNKMEFSGFQTRIFVYVRTASKERTSQLAKQILSAFRQFDNHPYQGFEAEEATRKYEEFIIRALDAFSLQILNTSELTALYHFPYVEDVTIFTKHEARPLPPPADIPTKNCLFFGKVTLKGKDTLFGIKKEDKLRHLYILGKSGTGKSTIIKNLAIGEILLGYGVCVIDPHGDLVEDILNYIPKHRIEDVIYFNPSDTEYPIGFNPVHLKPAEKEYKDVLADGILAVFKKHFSHSWGPRLEYILYNAILAVLASQGTTILSIQKILTDKKYRKRVLSHIKDPAILYFWRQEFARLEENKKLITEALSAIQNKVGRFLAPRIIRNILGQTRSTFNMQEIIRDQKILLVNLSKGQIGEENASLLGSLLITRLFYTALSQAKQDYASRKYMSLYIDEVQSFTTDVFPSILSEARKYKLSLTIAHQFIDQLDSKTVNAIFGNVGNMIILTLGNKDAKIIAEEFKPYLEPRDFVNLRQYHMYVKMLVDQRPKPPFSAKSVDILYRRHNLKEEIVNLSRKKYQTPVNIIEEKLNRWLSS